MANRRLRLVHEEHHTSHLSTSDGHWSVIHQGQSMCANTTESRARDVARKFKLDISHGRVWDGDVGTFVSER